MRTMAAPSSDRGARRERKLYEPYPQTLDRTERRLQRRVTRQRKHLEYIELDYETAADSDVRDQISLGRARAAKTVCVSSMRCPGRWFAFGGCCGYS